MGTLVSVSGCVAREEQRSHSSRPSVKLNLGLLRRGAMAVLVPHLGSVTRAADPIQTTSDLHGSDSRKPHFLLSAACEVLMRPQPPSDAVFAPRRTFPFLPLQLRDSGSSM
ncbi:unnamed protein product [Pleuronectes platessa]|uniref:Uncharacterized protein n=1 Tax=Pleuronectes platessa TaxID=8262 RepID=A0A9N7YP86_PLEPL|nr:unnamed protein product [Pleuronectes platessa]